MSIAVRRQTGANLRRFCEVYFPKIFYMPWSAEQTEAIAGMQEVALHGGRFAREMPRASGKSSLCMAVCFWAIATRATEIAGLSSGSAQYATVMRESMKTEIETNAELLADWPLFAQIRPVICHKFVVLKAPHATARCPDMVVLDDPPMAKPAADQTVNGMMNDTLKAIMLRLPEEERNYVAGIILGTPR